MFDALPDQAERHYTLNYYLYLVGWNEVAPQPDGLSSSRATELRAIAKAEALAWVSRRHNGRCRIIEWPQKEKK